MAEGKDNASLTGTRRLADAVRAAKIAAAQRSDVVVDIREADRARLEILAEALQGVAADLPAADDFFDFTIAGGTQPRFWIDGTAHVSMARDRRTYRFVRETRLGRVLLAESTDLRAVADRITTYVAERIVEREKAFAEADPHLAPPAATAAPAARPDDDAPLHAARPKAPSRAMLAVSWLLIGMVLGAGLLYVLALWRGVAIR